MTSSLFTKDQMMALGVKLVGIAGGALVTKGVMTSDQVSTIQTDLPAVVGAAGVLYAVIYSFWANRQSKQIAKVAAMPEVSSVSVTTSALADKITKVDPTTSTTVAAQ